MSKTIVKSLAFFFQGSMTYDVDFALFNSHPMMDGVRPLVRNEIP